MGVHINLRADNHLLHIQLHTKVQAEQCQLMHSSRARADGNLCFANKHVVVLTPLQAQLGDAV